MWCVVCGAWQYALLGTSGQLMVGPVALVSSLLLII